MEVGSGGGAVEAEVLREKEWGLGRGGVGREGRHGVGVRRGQRVCVDEENKMKNGIQYEDQDTLYCIVLYWVLPLHVLCILPAGLSFDLSWKTRTPK